MTSLYIHIPFCKSKCKYCAFYSLPRKKTEYLEALVKAMQYWGKKIQKPLYSVYIGGGTPSVLTPKELEFLLENIHSNFDTSKVCEFTLECNPESVGREFLSVAKSFGVDRISLGIQSFDDKELSAVGRLHNSETANNAIALIRECGFENISCDLIFGLPYQTLESLEKSVKTLVDADIAHISCYNLQIEEGTPLFKMDLPIPDEEIQEKMYYKICSLLKDNGYLHYEISNFAKSGFSAKHNSRYWDGSDYLGLGPSAHSKLGNLRAGFDSDIEKFITKTDFDFDFSEKITDLFFEKIMLSLRTSQGVDITLLKKSDSYIKMLCENGFAKLENNILKLTDKGFYLSNTIISDITAKEC